MSAAKIPGARSYWEQGTRFDKIAEVMSRNRFEQFKRFHHCSDKTEMYDSALDKLYNVKPITDLFKRKFRESVPCEYLYIDEHILPFKV